MTTRASTLMALALCLSLPTACSTATDEASPTTDPGPSSAAASAQQASSQLATPKPTQDFDPAKLEASGGVAYFAGGCFWGVEHFLEMIEGVYSVESGYMGGHLDNPSYGDVTSHESGHLETVRVYFDPAQVSYEAVAKRFFEIHDPTQANGQGPDIGPQYLSAVFAASDEQAEVTKQLIQRLRDRGYEVVTKVLPMATFWPAEEYHQDYYVRHKKVPYCHAPVNRFGDS